MGGGGLKPDPDPKRLYLAAPADGGGGFGRVLRVGGGGKFEPAFAHGFPGVYPDAGRFVEKALLPLRPARARPESYLDFCSGSSSISLAAWIV